MKYWRHLSWQFSDTLYVIYIQYPSKGSYWLSPEMLIATSFLLHVTGITKEKLHTQVDESVQHVSST